MNGDAKNEERGMLYFWVFSATNGLDDIDMLRMVEIEGE